MRDCLFKDLPHTQRESPAMMMTMMMLYAVPNWQVCLCLQGRSHERIFGAFGKDATMTAPCSTLEPHSLRLTYCASRIKKQLRYPTLPTLRCCMALMMREVCCSEPIATKRLDANKDA